MLGRETQRLDALGVYGSMKPARPGLLPVLYLVILQGIPFLFNWLVRDYFQCYQSFAL